VGVGFLVGAGVGVGFRVGAGVVAGWVGRAVEIGGGVCTMSGLPFGPGAEADGSTDGSDEGPPEGSTDGPPGGSDDGAIDDADGSELPPAPLVGCVVGPVDGPVFGSTEGGTDANAVVGPGRPLATAICPGRVGATTPAVSATVARMRFKSPMATTKRAR
jgi:hypothetical protein